MALISCPECTRPVSSEAAACPGCGYPVVRKRMEERARPEEAMDPHQALYEVRPSWWNFGWHIAFCWLVVPYLVALWRRHSYVMRIYPDRVSIEEGLWEKETTEFFIKDIRAIDVRRGFWGRMVGIGDVTVSTAATVDAAETACGVADPDGIKALLIARRQACNARSGGASTE